MASDASDPAGSSESLLLAIARDLGFKRPPLTLPKECLTEFVLPKGRATCGLVWMHGLGDDEEGWADMLEDNFRVPAACGSCKFVLPRAPRQPSSCNGGDVTTSWFDIADLPISRKSSAPYGCSLEEALSSCGRVHAAIDKLIAEGIPSERIMVGGFSQGGSMAMLSTLTYPKRLGGILVFSGICFFGDLLNKLAQAPHCKELQVFWGHGTRDEVLAADLQDEGVEALQAAGIKVTAKMPYLQS
ncbi:unnamed protein product [Durusdinium trenchii]|uniref:Phospholipase/carboxylesterase/thioesterase domain-containing protein n=1 Tax=Durusdinium trenchii TaxID=1381693 RepID=A0ABP0ICW7_9DINO